MDEEFLYYQIANSIRREINSGQYQPGDALPPVREIAKAWRCTIGTVQRAIRELQSAGLVTTHAGRRTIVTSAATLAPAASLQQANLIHHAETFLLESMTAGYTPLQVEDAMRVALNRWRAVAQAPTGISASTLRFSGSHDLAIAWMATHFNDIVPGFSMNIAFTGSLAGLLRLQQGDCDIAGMHLWDERSDTYNISFIRASVRGEKIALVTLAHRRLGFIVKPGNPLKIRVIDDLFNKEVRFINRQAGSGTRVYLDAQLKLRKIDPALITGYALECSTHSEIAAAVAESRADTGIGLEAAARGFGLDFVPLTTERYDLAMREHIFILHPVQRVIAWLKSDACRVLLNRLCGYENQASGQVAWVE